MKLSSALVSAVFILSHAVSADESSRHLRNGNPFIEDSVEYIIDIDDDDDDTTPQSYIVTFNDKVNNGNRPDIAQTVANGAGAQVDRVYSKALNGAAMTMPPSAARALANNPNVASIEKDKVVTASAASWGLDRIDQCIGLNSQATKVDANGVKVYVLDTGIHSSHSDFDNGGETHVDAVCSFSAFSSGSDQDPMTDGHGHGTHVAGTICGKTYGVANCGKLCAVKVLNKRGSGTSSTVIAGIEHAMNDCKSGEKCVANMSLGGSKSDAENNAVTNAVNAGVVMVVAAGNENTNACTKSPASATSAITVGATDRYDKASSFTNYGSCVDVYAPGVDIKSAHSNSDTSTATWGGTSMAAPHVAGIAAGHLQQGTAVSDMDQKIKGTISVQNVDCRTPGVGIATIGLTCTESNSCDGGGGGGGGPTTCGSCGPGPYGEEHDQRCCNHFGADMIATKVTPRRTTCTYC